MDEENIQKQLNDPILPPGGIPVNGQPMPGQIPSYYQNQPQPAGVNQFGYGQHGMAPQQTSMAQPNYLPPMGQTAAPYNPYPSQNQQPYEAYGYAGEPVVLYQGLIKFHVLEGRMCQFVGCQQRAIQTCDKRISCFVDFKPCGRDVCQNHLFLQQMSNCPRFITIDRITNLSDYDARGALKCKEDVGEECCNKGLTFTRSSTDGNFNINCSACKKGIDTQKGYMAGLECLHHNYQLCHLCAISEFNKSHYDWHTCTDCKQRYAKKEKECNLKACWSVICFGCIIPIFGMVLFLVVSHLEIRNFLQIKS